MDIVSRKAILRQLLAEARANKERAEQDADRVRLRVAEKVPVYADMSGAISRILIGASRRVLEDPAHGKEISAKAQREVLELKKRSEEALRAAGYTPEMLAPKYHCPICKVFGASRFTNTAPASRPSWRGGCTTRPMWARKPLSTLT